MNFFSWQKVSNVSVKKSHLCQQFASSIDEKKHQAIQQSKPKMTKTSNATGKQRQEKMLFLNVNQINADENHRCNSHLLRK